MVTEALSLALSRSQNKQTVNTHTHRPGNVQIWYQWCNAGSALNASNVLSTFSWTETEATSVHGTGHLVEEAQQQTWES